MRAMRHVIIDLETVGIDSAKDYIEPSSAPSNYKDEAKIAAFVKDADAEKVLKAGLDPDLARIVCIGWRFADSTHVGCVSFRTEDAEMNGLGYFWGQVRNCAMVTFNGRRFDLPLLMRRSMYLGVKHQPVSMDRYRSPHIDLYDRLTYFGAITAHSLNFYAKRLGWPCDEIAGKDIARLVAENTDESWLKIEAHCKSDVQLTFQLAERMGVIAEADAHPYIPEPATTEAF